MEILADILIMQVLFFLIMYLYFSNVCGKHSCSFSIYSWSNNHYPKKRQKGFYCV